MEKKKKSLKDFQSSFKQIFGLLITIISLVGVLVMGVIYVLLDPSLSLFKGTQATEVRVESTAILLDDADRIENGIHVETGFIEAPGMMITIQNCTNCHSSKLVIQNRMNEERWVKTIRWMQETQNLWDLGENEKIIVDYLVSNYPPKKVGRRANLDVAEWYQLDD